MRVYVSDQIHSFNSLVHDAHKTSGVVVDFRIMDAFLSLSNQIVLDLCKVGGSFSVLFIEKIDIYLRPLRNDVYMSW